MELIERDGIMVKIHRYGFEPGYYAEALRDGKRAAFTGVYRGKGSKRRAIEAALHEAKTGQPSSDYMRHPG